MIQIWFPNKYPTLNFQTEDFRAIIYENNPLFLNVLDFAREMIEQSSHFAIVIDRDSPGAFKITSSGEKGTWRTLGEFGREFVFDVKKHKL